MPYKLLIRLKNKAETPLEWLLIRVNGKTGPVIETNVSRQDVYALAKIAQTIIVLVPTEDLLLTEVKLPKLSLAKLMKAIPFALEDQLTEDPATLHFAASPAEKGGPVGVVVVSREKMQQWHTLLSSYLKDAMGKVKVFLPDVLANPWENGDFSILSDNGIAYVRTGHQSGFAIEHETLFTSLRVKLKHAQPKPARVILYNSTHSFTAEETAQLGLPVEYYPEQQDVLKTMATSLRDTMPINLLQGSYAPRQKKATLDQLIWIGFGIAAACLLIMTIANLATLFILRHENSILDRQLQQIYASINPGVTMPKDAKSQMQKELSSLRTSNTDSAFTRLLNIVGPGISRVINAGVNIKSMRYRNNQLVLEMEASDITSIENLRQSLESQGFKASLNNTERGASGLIETRLTVEEIS
jgi:general secretion pathway protein L